MQKHFPSPSARTDQSAYHIINTLNMINGGSGFMISIGEIDNACLIVALSGQSEQRSDLGILLESKLREARHPGFHFCVFKRQSSVHNSMLNHFNGKKHGMTYGKSRNCSEPKIIEMAAIFGKKLTAMTTFWYGPSENRAYKQGYLPYKDDRTPLGGARNGVIQFARPCEICKANEHRLMLYLSEGFPLSTRPRFGSYESPF